MYEGGLKAVLRRILLAIFVLVAIGVVVSFCKIVLDHIDEDGTVTSAKDVCKNEDAMSTLQKSGVFGGARPRCK